MKCFVQQIMNYSSFQNICQVFYSDGRSVKKKDAKVMVS